MVEDIHRAVVGDEKFGHRGLVSRMEENEKSIESTGADLAKFKTCVQKEQWGQRGFVGGISLAVTLGWNALMAWFSHGSK